MCFVMIGFHLRHASIKCLLHRSAQSPSDLWHHLPQVLSALAPDAAAAVMLMPKNQIVVYELFKEGVMVVKKDVHMAKYPELADKNVPNLHVMKAMQSLKSRRDGTVYLEAFLLVPY